MLLYGLIHSWSEKCDNQIFNYILHVLSKFLKLFLLCVGAGKVGTFPAPTQEESRCLAMQDCSAVAVDTIDVYWYTMATHIFQLLNRCILTPLHF